MKVLMGLVALLLGVMLLDVFITSTRAQVPISQITFPISCSASAPISMDGSSSVAQIIPAIAGRVLFICGYNLMAYPTVPQTPPVPIYIRLMTGTQTNSACDTGTTFLTGQYPVMPGGGLSYGGALGAVLGGTAVPVCVSESSGAKVGGVISYTYL